MSASGEHGKTRRAQDYEACTQVLQVGPLVTAETRANDCPALPQSVLFKESDDRFLTFKVRNKSRKNRLIHEEEAKSLQEIVHHGAQTKR